MENELADFSILWRNVGRFHDLSKVLCLDTSDTSEGYGYAWCRSHDSCGDATEDSTIGIDCKDLYENVRETEAIARLSRLRSHWDTLLFSAERNLDEIATLHEYCVRGLSDLTLKETTYCLNFKHVDQRFNELSARKKALSEKIAMVEEMYSHYAHYKCYTRTLDQIENNQFIKTIGASTSDSAEDGNADRSTEYDENVLVHTLTYVDRIAEKLNDMLPSIDASIDFFTIHSDYFNSDIFRYRYETMRTRVFSLIKLIFKELYNFANESCRNFTHFDIAEHYNKYRRIGRIIRNLNRYYTTQETELCNAEALQLQMYYITSRIKIMNPLMLLKMESFDDIGSITSFFLMICNLEILTFKETFISDETYESLGTLVENVAFYFMEACKNQVNKLETSHDLRLALCNIRDMLITPILSSTNEVVLQPLLLKAQQIHQTIELTLLKSIQKDIASKLRSYDKEAYIIALCNDTEFECDWDHESLHVLRGSDLVGAGLYPPVCFAIGIVLTHADCLGAQHLNRIATEVLDAVKAALIDVQYAFGKQCQLTKPLLKINQDLFLMRNLQFVLKKLDAFFELDSFQTVNKLYENSENQFCSNVTSLLMGDFQEFSRKQKAHDEEKYTANLDAAKRRLAQKIPVIKQLLKYQLLAERFDSAYASIMAGVQEIAAQHSKKFALQPPKIPRDYDIETVEPPMGHLLQL